MDLQNKISLSCPSIHEIQFAFKCILVLVINKRLVDSDSLAPHFSSQCIDCSVVVHARIQYLTCFFVVQKRDPTVSDMLPRGGHPTTDQLISEADFFIQIIYHIFIQTQIDFLLLTIITLIYVDICRLGYQDLFILLVQKIFCPIYTVYDLKYTLLSIHF